jgi:RimJ/RimL family protein N-acetyltransferase
MNAWGQPIGFPVPEWTSAKTPPRTPIGGRYCAVEPIDPARHAADLFEAISEDKEGRMWTYMAYGPFPTLADYEGWITSSCLSDDPLFFAIIETKTQRAAGVASLMRIDSRSGVVEVGGIHYAPRLMRTRAATEAMYLLMRRVFVELGYRRYEWKCDALNEPSRRAAQRLGFTFEGLFRQATVYKGRNRDTAWFSILDREWPALDRAYTQWLDEANFDEEGMQRRSLNELIATSRPLLGEPR